MKYIILLICLAITTLAAQAGELYRWVDKEGKVHYGDTPPKEAAKVEQKKFSSAAAQGEELPYETQRAQQNFPVTLYVGTNCGDPCVRARSLLNKRGIPFTEKSLTTKAEIDAFQKMSGVSDAPALQVGKIYLSGFSESAWNGELDAAGYPKTASYRQRATAKPSADNKQTTTPAQ